MSDLGETVERLAARVADGQPVDWEEALRSASDEREGRVIARLRQVESVARVHHSAGSATPAPRETSEMTVTMDAKSLIDPTPEHRTWAHLELRERIGEGGFGEVYRAWDRRLDREVALKLLKAERSGTQSVASKIIQEGRLLAKLRHPNVITVYGAEVQEGRVGLWMEFVRGRSLEQLLRHQGPFGAREATLIGIDLCRALAAVHRAGIVHRDVKAENAMREEGGRILLMDFGAGIEVLGERGPSDGSISGTPFYMAPELFLGEPGTQRSDIYSLGVLLYRLVTHSFPMEASSWSELRDKHRRRETKLLRDLRSDLPEAFVKVVERALAWKPEERFGTAGQMEQAMSVTLGTDGGPLLLPAGARRPYRVLGIAALFAAVLVVGLLLVPSLLRIARTDSGPPGAGHESGASSPTGPGAGQEVPVETRSELFESATGSAPPSVSGGRASAAVNPAPGSYTVEAALYRVPAESGERERLDPGAHLSLGDHLTLEFQASTPLHVYVIDEDEAGHSYALFPLPGLDQQNPLPPATKHVLPGSRDGKDLSWTVDSSGGREHLMVLASPTRLVEFEAEMNALARPEQSAVLISETAKVHLRGIGGLAESPASSGGKSAGSLFEMAQRLASRAEMVKGVWMRRIELENPRPR